MDAVAYGYDPFLSVNVQRFEFDVVFTELGQTETYALVNEDQNLTDYLGDANVLRGDGIKTYQEMVDGLNDALEAMIADENTLFADELEAMNLRFTLEETFTVTHPYPETIPGGDTTLQGIQIKLSADGFNTLENSEFGIEINPSEEGLSIRMK